RVAVAFPVEQVETSHLVGTHRVVALQGRVEFRREIADLYGLLVCVNRRTPVVIDRVCLCAFFRFQLDRFGVSAEYRSPSWGFADLLGVVGELDIKRVFTPHQLEEGFCTQLAKAETPRKQCQGSPFLEYRLEDPV